MKNIYIDETGKEIEYEESFWTGKRKITIDGVLLETVDKKSFNYNQNTYKVKGNILFGVKLIGENEIIIVPKLKVWEYILIMLPLILVFIGGATGAIIGMLFAIVIATKLRKAKNIIIKILFSLAMTGLAYLVWYIFAITILVALYS